MAPPGRLQARRTRQAIRRPVDPGAGRPLQRRHLATGEIAVLADLQRLVRDRPEPHAPQANDRMPHGVAHVPRLACAPLVQGDRDQRLIPARPEARGKKPGRGGRSAPPVDDEAAPEPIEVVLVGHAAHARVVLALDLVLRVEQPHGEFAVVGEQQEAFRVVVEAADGVDVVADLRQQIEDGGPVLGVLAGGQVAARLVQQDVPAARRRADPPAVHADVVPPGVGLRARRGDDGAVDRHAALGNERFGGAARCDAGSRQDLLQAFHGHSLSSAAKKSTRSRISRQSLRVLSSACVMTRLRSVRTFVRPWR